MKNKNLVIVLVVVFILSIVVVLKLYNPKTPGESISTFEAGGRVWNVKVSLDKPAESNKQYFVMDFYYNGDINDLRKIKEITFAEGTMADTQIVNILDRKFREARIAQGKYDEEQEKTYGIIISDFQSLDNNKIAVRFQAPPLNNETIYEFMKKSSMNIQINWTTELSGQDEFKDEIDIRV